MIVACSKCGKSNRVPDNPKTEGIYVCGSCKMPLILDKETENLLWFLNARYKYVWDKDTFADYDEVISQIVQSLIKDWASKHEAAKGLLSPDIGLFAFVDDTKSERPLIGYALYIADVRLPDLKTTLFSWFKDSYRISIGEDDRGSFMGMGNPLKNEELIRKFHPDGADALIERMRKRAKLVRHFQSIANKSINHRRSIKSRVRYRVLQRDNSTCRMCGRRPPEVKVHVDHITPVAWDKLVWDKDWKPSDDPADYQVLCIDCSLGKGDLSWMFG